MIHAILSSIFCGCMLYFRRPSWTCLWPAIFYISREFAQAEYRYVIKHCHGSFKTMPTFAGFYPEVWNMKSMLDWIIPLLVCLIFWEISLHRKKIAEVFYKIKYKYKIKR